MFNIQASIDSSTEIAEHTWQVIFKVDGAFRFVAGEYVTIALPQLHDLPLKKQFRDFSIASTPAELPLLTIAYRDSQSEFKSTLNKLSVGETVSIQGPKGVFTLPTSTDVPMVFIAGGIGITPFLSMVRSMIAAGESRKVSLYHFNRSPESAPYYSELQKMPMIQYVPKFGPLTSGDLPLREIETGNMVWYIAGPQGLTKTALAALVTAGVPDNAIKTEEFSGYA